MRALIIGCGSIGGRHARNLRSLGVDLAVTDVDPAAAAALAASTGAVAVTREDAPPCELVVVATPTAAHVDDLGWALARGSDVFVEKPLASSRTALEDATRLGSAHPDRLVMVGCNLRFSDGFMALSGALAAVGRPAALLVDFGWWLPAWRPQSDYRLQYSAQRALGGGIVLDAIHEIDYTLALAGPAAAVTARCTSTGVLDVDVEDCADITIGHAGGTQSHIHLDYLRRRYSRSCTVIGTEGELTWDVPRGIVELVREAGAEPETVAGNVDADPNAQYVAEMRHLLACVAARTPTANDLSRAAATTAVALVALEDSRG